MISLGQAAQKLQTGISGAGTAYEMGVNAMTEHPGEKAAKNKDGYVQGVIANQDKWATNVKKRSLSELKNLMVTKGKAALTASAGRAKEAWEKSMGNGWYEFIRTVQSECRAMPNITDGDKDARADHYRNRMREERNRRLLSGG